MPDPTGYGRIVRQGEAVQAIVEHKDATPEQRAITRDLQRHHGRAHSPCCAAGWRGMDNHNAQQEYYLTDVVKFAVADGCAVQAHRINDAAQVAGVNSPLQLAELERVHQRRLAEAFMTEGVRLADPAVLTCAANLVCGTRRGHRRELRV